jgi:hypothetical protein
MQPPDVREGSRPSCGARTIHNGADELLVSGPDGEIASLVQKGAQHTHRLCSFLPDLIEVRRPGVPGIYGHSQIENCRPIGLVPRKVLMVGAG